MMPPSGQVLRHATAIVTFRHYSKQPIKRGNLDFNTAAFLRYIKLYPSIQHRQVGTLRHRTFSWLGCNTTFHWINPLFGHVLLVWPVTELHRTRIVYLKAFSCHMPLERKPIHWMLWQRHALVLLSRIYGARDSNLMKIGRKFASLWNQIFFKYDVYCMHTIHDLCKYRSPSCRWVVRT